MALAPEATSSPGIMDRVKGVWQKKEQPAEAPEDKTAESSQTKFRRNLFVNTLNPRSAERGAKKESTKSLTEAAKPSEFVGFNEKTRAEFTTFLDGYLQDIVETGQRPGGMDILKAQPHAAEFFTLIGADKNDFSSDTIPTKVTEILAHPEGWIQTKALIEQETALALALAGMASAAEGGDRPNDPNTALKDMQKDNKTRPTGWRRVVKNGWTGTIAGGALGGSAGFVFGEGMEELAENGAFDALGRFIGDVAKNTGDYAANSPFAFTTTVLATGALGALYGRRMSQDNKEGTPESERLKVVGEALQSVQGNDALRGYIKSRYKIDVNDYQFAGGKLSLVPTPDRRSTGDVRDVMDQALKNFKTRESYYDDLGIPKDARDVMPEQFLVTDKDPERHSERIHHDIMDKYYELGGDRSQSPDNFKKMRKAREFVMANMTEQLATKINGPEGPKDVSKITAKIADRSEGGTYLETQQEEKRKENEALSERQVAMKGRKEDIEAYDAQKKQLKEAQAALPDYVKETFGQNIEDLSVTEIAQRLRAIRGTGTIRVRKPDGSEDTVTHKILSVTVDGKTYNIAPIEERRSRATKEYNDAYTSLMGSTDGKRQEDEPNDLYKERFQKLNESNKAAFDAEMAAIKEEADILHTIETTIKALEDREKKSKEALEPTAETVKKRHMAVYMRDVTDVSKATLLVNKFGNELLTLSPSELISKINQEYESTKGTAAEVGWDEKDNEDITTQEVLNYSLILQRINKDYTDPTTNPSLIYFGNDNIFKVLNLDITQEQIENTDKDALKDLINARITPPFDDGQIQTIKDGVENFAKAVSTAINQLNDETLYSISRNDRVALSVDAEKEVAQLEVARDLMEQQGRIFGMRREFMSKISSYVPENSGTLVKIDDLDEIKKKEYTESEKAVGGTTPVAYYEIMNLMFDYKGKVDKDEYFKKLHEQIPPDTLHKLLVLGAKEAEMPPAITGSGDLNTLLIKLQDEIKKGLITMPALRRMFTGVIDNVAGQAMALP